MTEERRPHVSVRELEPTDIPPLAALQAANVAHISTFLRYPPTSPADLIRRLTTGLAANAAGSAWYGVIEVETTLVGQVAVAPISAEDPRHEVICWVAADHTGSGVGASAIRQGCAIAFERLDIDHIVGRLRSSNEASHRAVRSVGFWEVARDQDSDWIEMRLDHPRGINPRDPL